MSLTHRLTIATFNLCNFGTATPPTRLRKLALTIVNTLESPDIIALQEVTAPGPGSFGGRVSAEAAYLALINAITAADGPLYAFREVPPLAQRDGGMAGANIRVGLLFNPARVHLCDRGTPHPEHATELRWCEGQPQLTLNPGRIEPLHKAFEGDERQGFVPSRKAMAVEFTIHQRPLFVIVCHLKSMRAQSKRALTSAQKQRHAQAMVIHRFAAQLLLLDPHAWVIILGDMNDSHRSKTLSLLKGGRFANLIESLAKPYTHRQNGRPQALDHILVSPELRHRARLDIPHVNSDAALLERGSDHDPVWVELLLPPPTQG